MTDMISDPYITDPRTRDLAATVYHFIKNNPDTWEQDMWRCETGMCFAGWIVATDELSEWSADVQPELREMHEAVVPSLRFPDEPRSKIAPWDTDKNDYADPVEYVEARTRAISILGLRPAWDGRGELVDPELRHQDLDEDPVVDLFQSNNGVEDIRDILTVLLGQDPETIPPNEDFYLSAKRANGDLKQADSQTIKKRRNKASRGYSAFTDVVRNLIK